ncbi:LysM peptidoglycan-binding domain-containing protein [Paenibacillus sp. FSL R7-0163]|uniref:LysM peptidoglycan-binding domain-containing protein n=1 Tax=Paenibacillus sp. FSL R7-0163 TaxID=2954530 RepID=UPI0030D73870
MKIHIVKQGDSLYALSQKYGVPLQKLIEANPQISNPNVLAVGDKVKIPTAPVSVPENSEVYYKHTVKQGDTLWKLSKAWGIPLKDMVEANPQLKNPNVLMLGEVVNIPKKVSNTSPTQPGYTPSNASEKTQVGGKEYTGPKEQPAAEVVPAPKPETKPEVKPETKPEAKPAPNPAPNMQMEVAPVQEIEMQSLFVQITVPNQEPIAQQEAPKAEKKADNDCTWDNSNGYPGLGGNPYLYDSYQNSPNMNMNWAPSYVQPMAYAPECISPCYFSGNMYSNMSPEQWNPNAAPNISPEQWNPNAAPNISPEQWNPNAAPNISPEQWSPNAAPNMSPGQWNPMEANVAGMNVGGDFSPYAVPQYGGQTPNLPWPTCGCGGVHIQPVQTYSYDMPVYNTYPEYGNPNAFSAYGAGMPNQGMVPTSTLGAFGGQDNSNIPSNPQYPGIGNYSQHNRVPEIQEPEVFVQESPEAARTETDESTSNASLKNKGSVAKETATGKKAKTSGQPSSKKSKTATKSQGSAASTKKRRNPWISN